MKAEANRHRADYVRPTLSEARVARMWAAAEQPGGRRLTAVRWAMAGSLATAACVLLVLLLRGESKVVASGELPVTSGATFRTGAAERPVTLPDGSQLALGPTTLLDVVRVTADEVRLRLRQGVLTCDVPERAGRRFVVEAAGTEIAVKGTRFTVDLEPEATARPALSVSVARGRVLVRRNEQEVMATLDAGQQWSSQRPPLPVPTAQPTGSNQDSAPSAAAPSLTARELMERANAAHMAGQAAAAAKDYDRLRLRFPNDARAGLAAFELARIRLKALSDARGAVEAFRFALAHNNGGFFAEDAEAGIVEALHRMGDTEACSKARDDFLANHAKSPHLSRLKPLCLVR